jgi:hypothetical protein
LHISVFWSIFENDHFGFEIFAPAKSAFHAILSLANIAYCHATLFLVKGGNMNAVVQLDMFRETTEEDVLKAELVALSESHHAVRKSTFARIGALTKLVMDQQNEIDFLKVKLGLACPVQPQS